MEDLIIKKEQKTYMTPEVVFSASTGICEISGESYQEETFEFYNRILDWLKQFIDTVKKPLILNFKFTYFNTSSSRAILEILILLRKYRDSGGQVTINWYYNDPEDSMYQEAEGFSMQTTLPFNMILVP